MLLSRAGGEESLLGAGGAEGVPPPLTGGPTAAS